MKSMSVSPSNRDAKKLKAVFKSDGKTKTVHFGQKGSSTYLDHKNKQKRTNYIKRHSANEKHLWSDPTKPATLSRFILWGPSTSLRDAVSKYKRRFKLK